MPTADWLAAHGLDYLRLTIFDVLAPTAVPHRSNYVRILDKEVFGKVRSVATELKCVCVCVCVCVDVNFCC
jgi:hypothetical protein